MRFLPKFPILTFFLSIVSPFLALADNGFQITPSSLTFTADPGKGAASQTLHVTTNDGTPVSYSVSLSSGLSGCYKLSVYPVNGRTPSDLTVGAETQSLPAGSYNCTITLTTTGVGGFNATVPVTMNVGSNGGTSGGLNVAPTSLNLATGNGVTSASGTVTLTNTSSGPVNFTTYSNQTWLAASPVSGTVTTSGALTITANGTGMLPGTYSGTVTITPGNGAAILVQVSLTISAGPSVQLQRNGSAVTSVAFAYQTGTTIPAAQTFTLVSSDATPIACTVSQSTSTAYLTIAPQGTVYTPATITMTPNAAGLGGLSTGVYSTELDATCLGASNQTLRIPVTFSVSAVPLLTISSTPSPFNYQPGGSLPGNQFVQLATTSNSAGYSALISYNNGNGWLSVSPSAGTASAANPVTLTLGISPQNLSAGTYSAVVSIYSGGAANSPLTFPVTLIVGNGGGGSLVAQPTSLSFNYQLGQALPPSQNVNITAGSTNVAFTATAFSQTCPGVLNVSPSSSNTPTTLTVSVMNTGILTPQVCSGQISLSVGGGSTLTIPVSVTVSASAVLQVYPNAWATSGTLGDGTQNNQTFAVTTSDGLSAIPVSVTSSASWLTVSPATGNAPLTITASVNNNASGLHAGSNDATISVVGSGSSVSIPVSVVLSSTTTVAANPGNLAFTQPYGGPAPAAQSFSLSLGGGTSTSLPFYISVISGGTNNWVVLSPTSGSVPGTVSVSVSGNNLPLGTYNAVLQVTVTGASNSPLSIPLSFTVTAPSTVAVAPQTLSFTAPSGGSNPAPQVLQLTSSGSALNFTATTSVTSCGNFLSVSPNSGTVGTTPVALNVSANVAGLSPGTCSGSVTVTAAGSNVQTIPVTFTVTAAQPAITSIVNAASFAPGALAPGEIVTLFGTNIGPSTLTLGAFQGFRFSTNVGGTQVLFDTFYAPVIYAKDSQVSVVVPYEVAGRLQSDIKVLYNNQTSAAMQMRVQDAAPGIFTTASSGSGQGSIVNQNGTINSVSAPAPRGSVVAVYLTGLGQTDPQGTTGAPGSANPLQTVKNVSATIGNTSATVQFAGAAPSYIQGLYQVNLMVPAGAASGSQPVTIAVNGVATPSGVTMYIQ